MINEKFKEILAHPADGAIAIVTQGAAEPHVVNSWNSYVIVKDDVKLLIPVGGMNVTESNLEKNDKIQLTVANREVTGKMYKGTGFLVKGTAAFLKEGSEFDEVKAKFTWARAALVVTVESAEQTL